MATIRFTVDRKVAGRSKGGLTLQGEPPKLPPIDSFKLNNIINSVENSKQLRKEIVDSVLRINNNYTEDLDDQIKAIRDIEQEEIIRRFEDITIAYSKVGKEATVQLDRRRQKMENIQEDMSVVNEQLRKSTRRVNEMIDRLKRLEKQFPVKDRLFDMNSPNDDHYRELFDRGMRKEIEEKNRRDKEELESRVISDNLSSSPTKMRQYIELEKDIEELQRTHSRSVSKFKNPTRLTVIEVPIAELNSEEVTVRSRREGEKWKGELRKLAKRNE
ncbi:hypothetical protein FOA43_001753 [Brettanomyces nanus]|uniref:Uncharacterized protein n=1 Tax=Eeniella nana TaxID=13502 RepID=A0A875S5F0_EENNA|nr:uncharacterized protein FOA43_001753 [Brettanomyces nanus]QPG74424.1 hypothetical protein FOA43_001753 [Brettanomyces nanus]